MKLYEKAVSELSEHERGTAIGIVIQDTAQQIDRASEELAHKLSVATREAQDAQHRLEVGSTLNELGVIWASKDVDRITAVRGALLSVYQVAMGELKRARKGAA